MKTVYQIKIGTDKWERIRELEAILQVYKMLLSDKYIFLDIVITFSAFHYENDHIILSRYGN